MMGASTPIGWRPIEGRTSSSIHRGRIGVPSASGELQRVLLVVRRGLRCCFAWSGRREKKRGCRNVAQLQLFFHRRTSSAETLHVGANHRPIADGSRFNPNPAWQIQLLLRADVCSLGTL